MAKTILCACLTLLALTLGTKAVSAQDINYGTYNESVPAGSGTLSYTVIVSQPIGCGEWVTYLTSTYYNFSYAVGGTTYPLTGRVVADHGSSIDTCPGTTAPPLELWAPSDEITFTPTSYSGGLVCTDACIEGSATVTPLTPGIVYPLYQVQSIIYQAPGNHSLDGFQNTETDGTTTSSGMSFTEGDTVTFSVTFGFLFGTSTLSWSYGNAVTTGSTTATTETISDASGVNNVNNASGPNTINHQNDLFIIWLNPAVSMYQTGPTSVSYAQGTQYQVAGDPQPGQPEIQDQVEVYASAMMANAQGVTTVPVEKLIPQVVYQVVNGVEVPMTMPGLANICKDPVYYPNSCTLANQCGCTPSDFTPILAQDPLLNYTSTEDPLNADASGASACSCPTSADDCRYVPIPAQSTSCLPQFTEALSGPDDAGGGNPQNTFTITDTNTNTETLLGSDAVTVGYSWKTTWGTAPPEGAQVGVQNAQTWTWTNSESTGKINGSAHTESGILSSSTVGCSQNVLIFEDTVYHTFVFQQPPDNTSCP
jgi:hypothetical protein